MILGVPLNFQTATLPYGTTFNFLTHAESGKAFIIVDEPNLRYVNVGFRFGNYGAYLRYTYQMNVEFVYVYDGAATSRTI